MNLGGDSGDQGALGVGDLELDPEGAGGLVGLRRDVAHPPLHGLARNQSGLAGRAHLDVVALLLGHVSRHQHGIFLQDPSDRGPVVDVVAEHDHALIEAAGEGRAQPGARDVDFHSGDDGPRRLQVGLGRRKLALRLKVLGGQLLRRFELDLPLPGERCGLAPAGLEGMGVQPDHLFTLGDLGAALGSDRDDAPVDSRAQGERTDRLGTPAEDDGAAHRLRPELRHPHLEVPLALQRGFLVGRGRRRGAAGAVARPHPSAHPRRDREGDDERAPSSQEGSHDTCRRLPPFVEPCGRGTIADSSCSEAGTVLHRGCSQGRLGSGRRAMKSISTRTPRASAVTPMQVRAGRRSGGKTALVDGVHRFVVLLEMGEEHACRHHVGEIESEPAEHERQVVHGAPGLASIPGGIGASSSSGWLGICPVRNTQPSASTAWLYGATGRGASANR